MLAWLRRWLVRASAASVLLGAIAAIPAWLTLAVGWPLPHTMPDQQTLVTFLNGGVTDQMVVNLLAIAIWLTWALFAQAVLAELRDTIRGVKHHQQSHHNPMRTAASILISSMLLGSILTATTATATPQPGRAATDPPATAAQSVPASTRTAHGTTIVQVGSQRYAYTVKRGDHLSKIAKAWLGDADRWPEICDLNWHRHFPKSGGTLRDCNLIYPGWDLRLPTDARPPTTATPVEPPTTPSRPPATPGASVAPSPAADNPALVVPAGAPSTAPASPSAHPSAPTSPSPVTPNSPHVSESPSTSPATSDSHHPETTTDEHGVRLGSNWLPWSLAIAISAATVLVWLQRRRRYTGQPDDDPPTQLPPPVVQLRRAVARKPELIRPDAEEAEPPAPVPDLASLPAGGAGSIGEGANAAARAALVAVLASGGPHHPAARGEVVIDATTLVTLLGPDVVTLGPWPRLHVTDSLDDALTIIESRLLHRSRILDEHALTDLDELRQQAPDEEALPPVMLITETPPAGTRMRAKTALALGNGLHIRALLLGEWTHGATLDITPDGHTTLVTGQPAEPVPPRLPVLDPHTAIQILTTLREAQTGEPPAIASPALPVALVPLHASRTDTTPGQTPASAPPAATAAPGKAKLRVLGPPRIEDITAQGRALRAKALELAVYLACHPDGAATREIGEYLEPDARISQADQRVHTNASNLRHVLARAGTAEARNGYVIKTAGRYRLDPATVDVDVWHLRDLLRTATIASGPRRRELLTTACDIYTEPLAQGQDYEWLPPHRETVRRWGIEAHLLLADDLLDHDPQAASDLLDKAIGLDRYNEALYVKAMHARHALGDADGIRTLTRALTKALADLDAEPQEDTIALASTLRTSLDEK